MAAFVSASSLRGRPAPRLGNGGTSAILMTAYGGIRFSGGSSSVRGISLRYGGEGNAGRADNAIALDRERSGIVHEQHAQGVRGGHGAVALRAPVAGCGGDAACEVFQDGGGFRHVHARAIVRFGVDGDVARKGTACGRRLGRLGRLGTTAQETNGDGGAHGRHAPEQDVEDFGHPAPPVVT